jgi:hypothetical protein
VSLSNLASKNTQLLRRKPTCPGISDNASERGTGVEGIGTVPKARLGNWNFAAFIWFHRTRCATLTIGWLRKSVFSQCFQRRIKRDVVVRVDLRDEFVGCVAGYDYRYRSGDEDCAVVGAEQVGFT